MIEKGMSMKKIVTAYVLGAAAISATWGATVGVLFDRPLNLAFAFLGGIVVGVTAVSHFFNRYEDQVL